MYTYCRRGRRTSICMNDIKWSRTCSLLWKGKANCLLSCEDKQWKSISFIEPKRLWDNDLQGDAGDVKVRMWRLRKWLGHIEEDRWSDVSLNRQPTLHSVRWCTHLLILHDTYCRCGKSTTLLMVDSGWDNMKIGRSARRALKFSIGMTDQWWSPFFLKCSFG